MDRPRVEVTLTGDVAELSPNQRLHHLERGRRMALWRQQARLRYLDQRGPSFIGPVRLSFIVRRCRRLDCANVHGSGALKAAEDGLVDAGMVADDNPVWVQWGTVKQEVGPEWKYDPELVILIEEII